eukprot:5914110-Alexandrium_andersonii.AAC.1
MRRAALFTAPPTATRVAPTSASSRSSSGKPKVEAHGPRVEPVVIDAPPAHGALARRQAER